MRRNFNTVHDGSDASHDRWDRETASRRGCAARVVPARATANAAFGAVARARCLHTWSRIGAGSALGLAGIAVVRIVGAGRRQTVTPNWANVGLAVWRVRVRRVTEPG